VEEFSEISKQIRWYVTLRSGISSPDEFLYVTSAKPFVPSIRT